MSGFSHLHAPLSLYDPCRRTPHYDFQGHEVSNRGVPPDDFLRQLVVWGKQAPLQIFDANAQYDIYSSVSTALGPWHGLYHRRAVMLEVMRVLAGFESSWRWTEGRDIKNPSSNTAVTTEAGAWQVSANSMSFGAELKALVKAHAGKTDGVSFQAAMKRDHPLAMEYIARLLRRTTRHNGPVSRHENRWLAAPGLRGGVRVAAERK